MSREYALRPVLCVRRRPGLEFVSTPPISNTVLEADLLQRPGSQYATIMHFWHKKWPKIAKYLDNGYVHVYPFEFYPDCVGMLPQYLAQAHIQSQYTSFLRMEGPPYPEQEIWPMRVSHAYLAIFSPALTGSPIGIVYNGRIYDSLT